MKYRLIYLTTFLILFSCNKIKLEKDERGEKIIGTWRYATSGKIVGFDDFTIWSSYQPKDYQIEFQEKGKLVITTLSSSIEYNIEKFAPLDLVYSTYAEWHQQVSYEIKGERKYIRIHYFGDSIMIDQIPYDLLEQGSQAGNMFYRVE